MVQGGKKMGGGKAKSAGSARKQIGKMKRGLRDIKPKKANLVKAAKLQKKFDKEKRTDIEATLAAKTAASHSFKVVKPDMSKAEPEKKGKKK